VLTGITANGKSAASETANNGTAIPILIARESGPSFGEEEEGPGSSSLKRDEDGRARGSIVGVADMVDSESI
jgi:hypothetical protein